MENINFSFNGVDYSIPKSSLAATFQKMEAAFNKLSNNIEPEILEGSGAEYYTLAPTALSFRSSAPLNEFQEVQVNGVTVDPSCYTLEEGSTIVKLSIEYLKNLEVGDYGISILSDTKKVDGGFTIVAPELNEYGFYYNQPYMAYVGPFGGNTVFFLREGGVMEVIVLDNGYTEVATYTVNDNYMTVNANAGTFTGTIADDGKSIYVNELYNNFTLGNDYIVADKDYIYIYKEDLSGYEVTVIDKTKAEYDDIKTGINGIDTVKLADRIFSIELYQNNETLMVAPKIPDTVLSVGEDAFANCVNLTSMILPGSIKSIGDGAFANCVNLTSVAIGNDVTSIGVAAFYKCLNLETIVVPDNTTTISKGAFEDCRALTNILLGSRITSIDKYMLRNCYKLTYIEFNGTISQWNTISKGDEWNKNIPATHVHCIDGDVEI